MSIRISNLRLRFDEPETELPSRLARVLGIPQSEMVDWRILRKSLDARDNSRLGYVYSAEIRLPDHEEKRLIKKSASPSSVMVELFEATPFEIPVPGVEPLTHPPVVIGSGPGGLLAAFLLAQWGYRPIVLERGKSVRDRIHATRLFDAGGAHDPENNYLFGEGGAGTFSDGKLTCRGSGADVQQVLEILANHNGKPSILYDQRPHLGSNRLPAVVKALRRAIIDKGGEIRFGAKVSDLEITDGRLNAVMVGNERIPTRAAILAIGHSARDTYRMLLQRGVPIEQKPFQLGVRIEGPQEVANRIKYGSKMLESILGPADYGMAVRGLATGRDLFTFCMCAGGYIMPSASAPDYFCTNGMSLSTHDSPYANSGLVVTLETSEFPGTDPLAGMRLQENIEKRAFELGGGDYACPAQRATDFIAGKLSTSLPGCSYPRRVFATDLREVLPPVIAEVIKDGLPLMDRRWNGKFLAEAILVGPESRGSSPVRLPRNPVTRQSLGVEGLYPVGEGAGFAGGIVSAAVDGLISARAIIKLWSSNALSPKV